MVRLKWLTSFNYGLIGQKHLSSISTKTVLCETSCTHEVWLCTQEIKRRGLKVAVVGIPKTIDNDIPVRTLLLYMSKFYVPVMQLY